MQVKQSTYRDRKSSSCYRCRRRRARRTTPWTSCASGSCCPRRCRRGSSPATRCASCSGYYRRRRRPPRGSSPAPTTACGAGTATGCATATCRSTACCSGAACGTTRTSCVASTMSRARTRCPGRRNPLLLFCGWGQCNAWSGA